MTHSALLRLLRSEYFDFRLGLIYLFRYVKNIGIQSFILHQLRDISEEELRFILPQLCHLLITHNSQSGAIEKFLIERCVRSSHLALEAVWFMEAHFLDLKKTSPDSDACKSAKQVLIEFHNAINNSAEMYSKIDDHVEEAIMGITSIFCAFGTPQIHDMMKDNILYLGKRLRRKVDTETQKKVVEKESTSPNMSLLKRASADIEDFGNSLFNLPFGRFHNSLHNFLNKDDANNFHVARYFLAETQFLNSLMDISERLRILPKDNRQKR